MEPEVVIAVIAPGLAISTRSIETLPNTLHVGTTFEADRRLKGIVHELEATGFGEPHSYSFAASLVCGHGASSAFVYTEYGRSADEVAGNRGASRCARRTNHSGA